MSKHLPAAGSCLISLIIYIMGGFLAVDRCPFIPRDKTNLSHGPTQLNIGKQQPVMVWKCDSLVGHCVAQIEFELPLLALLRTF